MINTANIRLCGAVIYVIVKANQQYRHYNAYGIRVFYLIYIIFRNFLNKNDSC